MVEIANKNDFDELMKTLNDAFNFKEEKDKFEHLLPKIYYKENDKMKHFIIRKDNKIVSSVGLYPMKLISKYGKIKVASVGAVSTLKDYRKNGYFDACIKQLIKYAKENNYVMLFLGGDRIRYGHYGFTFGGRNSLLNFNQRCKEKLKDIEFKDKIVKKDNYSLIEKIKKLYYKNHICVNREDKFYEHLLSWNSVCHAIYFNHKFIGYYCIKDNYVLEANYILKYENEFFRAILADKNEVNVCMPIYKINENLKDISNYYSVINHQLFNILDYKQLFTFLGIDQSKYSKLDKLNDFEKIRFVLGDCFEKSKLSKIDFAIFENDCA